MAALAIANKKLVARGLILVRGNVFDDASLGRFYLKRVSDGEIVARDVSPGRVAESLAGKNCDAFYG